MQEEIEQKVVVEIKGCARLTGAELRRALAQLLIQLKNQKARSAQQGKGPLDAQAYLKVEVNGQEGINAAEGDGPVNALDLALRKTLAQFYPSIRSMRLKDFKVRVLNSQGTASRVRVSIESTDGVHLWKTVGVHNNIIQASLRALTDSVDYMLTKYVSPEEIAAAAARKSTVSLG